MGDHQQRLWRQMIRATEEYLVGDISLREVITQLEGSLHASELKAEDLIREFYDHWGPLETQYACSVEMGTPIDHAQLRQSVEAMKEFLILTENQVSMYDPTE